MDNPELSSESPTTIAKYSLNGKRAAPWLNIALAMMGPLLLLGLMEAAAYVWELRQANSLYAWEHVASRRMVWKYYQEPGAGYTLMRPGSHYEWQGITVEINSHGLRGPEISYAKPPDTFRILNLGDSIVMGWGVREEDTYGRRLESILNEGDYSDLNFEVINAGVPGWNMDNALAYLQAEGFKYKPDLIVMDITIANDINGKSALLAGNDSGPFRWLSDHTYFWPFLQSQAAWAKARLQGKEREDTINPPTNPAKYFPLDPESDRWTERWNTILEINRLASEKNIPVVLVFFPLEFQVLDENFSTLPQELLSIKAAEAGIPVLDPLPVFRQTCLQKPGGPCHLEDRYLFADVWMHPSAEGHKLVAAELEAYLSGMVKP